MRLRSGYEPEQPSQERIAVTPALSDLIAPLPFSPSALIQDLLSTQDSGDVDYFHFQELEEPLDHARGYSPLHWSPLPPGGFQEPGPDPNDAIEAIDWMIFDLTSPGPSLQAFARLQNDTNPGVSRINLPWLSLIDTLQRRGKSSIYYLLPRANKIAQLLKAPADPAVSPSPTSFPSSPRPGLGSTLAQPLI